MKKIILIILTVFVCNIGWAQIIPQWKALNGGILNYYPGKSPNGYDSLMYMGYLRSKFKLQLDSVNNDGYVTHGYLNSHPGSGNFGTAQVTTGGLTTKNIIGLVSMSADSDLTINTGSSNTTYLNTPFLNLSGTANVNGALNVSGTTEFGSQVLFWDNNAYFHSGYGPSWVVDLGSFNVSTSTLSYNYTGIGIHNYNWTLPEKSGTIAMLSDITGGGGTWGSITGTLSDQTDLQTALNGKQASLGFTAENIGNKQNSLTADGSGVKYPTVDAINASGFITPSSTNTLTNKTWQGIAIADGYISSASTWSAKQAALISGTNIKSINSTSLLGSGNINLQTPLTAGTDYLAPNGSAASLISFPTLNQNTTGNALTATSLATARTINGTSFNGTSDITVTASAGTLTGSVLNSAVVTSSLTSLGTIATGVWQGTAIGDSYISSASTWNSKQSALSGTGYVKLSGTTPFYITAIPSTDIASMTSSNLRTILSDETGTGLAYFQGGDIGTPSAGVGTNFTGTASGLTAGNASKWATARNLAGNSVDGSANVNFSNKFIVQGTTDAGLSGAQFLGALSTGIVKNTNSTGVLSIAVSGTDYQAPLVSGTSIKTINSASLLGSGNILLQTPLIAGTDYTTPAGTEIITNKRVTKRVGTTTSSSAPTPAGDSNDVYTVTALAANATFGAPTGTPTDGQTLLIRVKDNGTARTLAWNVIYRASTDLALPTTSTVSKTIYLFFIYNSADLKWDLTGLTNGF